MCCTKAATCEAWPGVSTDVFPSSSSKNRMRRGSSAARFMGRGPLPCIFTAIQTETCSHPLAVLCQWSRWNLKSVAGAPNQRPSGLLYLPWATHLWWKA